MEVEGTWEDAWEALEAAYDAGTVRAIGLSNFGERLIKLAIKQGKVRPHVVQNWMVSLVGGSGVFGFTLPRWGNNIIITIDSGPASLGRGRSSTVQARRHCVYRV